MRIFRRKRLSATEEGAVIAFEKLASVCEVKGRHYVTTDDLRRLAESIREGK